MSGVDTCSTNYFGISKSVALIYLIYPIDASVSPGVHGYASQKLPLLPLYIRHLSQTQQFFF